MSVRGRDARLERAGARVLSLLSIPLNAAVMETLTERPRALADLGRGAGLPPPTTMRSHLRALAETGVVEKRSRREFASSVDYRLTAAGQELSPVTRALTAWLAAAPGGPIALGSDVAKRAIKAFLEGWTTGIVHSLAARPLSLTELDVVITTASYPSLERRLSAMRMLGMVEAAPGPGRSIPYAVTDWLRHAIAPLVAAARWELGHRPAQAPAIVERDVETAFLLVLPLLQLRKDLSGSCRLAVRLGTGAHLVTAGTVAQVRDGSVHFTSAPAESAATAWATGPGDAWLAAVIECDVSGLDMGGEIGLAIEIVEQLHQVLFGKMTRR